MGLVRVRVDTMEGRTGDENRSGQVLLRFLELLPSGHSRAKTEWTEELNVE